MKPTLLFTTFLFAFVSPAALAKSELELLRQRCAEQERQIRLLEEENLKLRMAGERYRPATNTASTVPAPAAPTSTASGTASTYTIKAGDSLERIARRHNTTTATLIRLNNIKDPQKIQPGQKIKLPAAAATPTATASSATRPTSAAQSTAVKAPTTGSHLVAPGETFYSIGKKYGVPVAQLTAANPSIQPASLRPGQRIQLGTAAANHSPAAVAKAPAPQLASGPPQTVSTAKSPATQPPPVPETPKTAAKPEVRLVKINSPTTYGEFASTHGNSVGRLNELNNLELGGDTVLAVGSELYVSVQP